MAPSSLGSLAACWELQLVLWLSRLGSGRSIPAASIIVTPTDRLQRAPLYLFLNCELIRTISALNRNLRCLDGAVKADNRADLRCLGGSNGSTP